jgi:hypothetical protein
LKDHSQELLELERRLERVINNAIESKDEDIATLRRNDDYFRAKQLEELHDDVRKS